MSNPVFWDTEFPAEFAPPAEFLALVETGELQDFSWHNDACPSFGAYARTDKLIRIWSLPQDKSLRERETDTRYFVAIDDDLFQPFETNDPHEAIDTFRELMALLKRKSS